MARGSSAHDEEIKQQKEFALYRLKIALDCDKDGNDVFDLIKSRLVSIQEALMQELESEQIPVMCIADLQDYATEIDNVIFELERLVKLVAPIGQTTQSAMAGSAAGASGWRSEPVPLSEKARNAIREAETANVGRIGTPGIVVLAEQARLGSEAAAALVEESAEKGGYITSLSSADIVNAFKSNAALAPPDDSADVLEAFDDLNFGFGDGVNAFRVLENKMAMLHSAFREKAARDVISELYREARDFEVPISEALGAVEVYLRRTNQRTARGRRYIQ